MSDDNEIGDVIATARIDIWDEWGDLWGTGPLGRTVARRVIAALRAAGYDIAPADTIRLGQAVEATERKPTLGWDQQDPALHIRRAALNDGWNSHRHEIYQRAGVEQGGE